MHVVCAGHLNWDVRLRVDRLPTTDDESRIERRYESGGGSAANVAVALADLDREAHFLGAAGDDERGSEALSRLERAGVEPHVCLTDEPTTTKYVLVDDTGEVALLGTDGANESFGAGDIPTNILGSAAGLHLTAQPPKTAEALARFTDDTVVSFDPGRRGADRDYDNLLDHVDILFATAREAQALDTDVPAVVTKRGSDGATWSGPDGVVESDGIDIGTAVDTTGAGDAFAAGFLAVWLENRTPEHALSVANACGALAAGEEGPDANLSWARIEAIGDR